MHGFVGGGIRRAEAVVNGGASGELANCLHVANEGEPRGFGLRGKDDDGRRERVGGLGVEVVRKEGGGVVSGWYHPHALSFDTSREEGA